MEPGISCDAFHRLGARSTTCAITVQHPLIREEFNWSACGVPSDRLHPFGSARRPDEVQRIEHLSLRITTCSQL